MCRPLLTSGDATAERGSGVAFDSTTIFNRPPSPVPSSLRTPNLRWSWIMMVKAKQINLSSPNLSHHLRPAQSSSQWRQKERLHRRSRLVDRFTRLAPQFSASHTKTRCTLKLEHASSFSLSFQRPSHQHVARKCPQPFYPIKKREQKGKAVVINEEIVHTADANGNGDAKIAQKRPLKRQKSESTNAKPPSNG